MSPRRPVAQNAQASAHPACELMHRTCLSGVTSGPAGSGMRTASTRAPSARRSRYLRKPSAGERRRDTTSRRPQRAPGSAPAPPPHTPPTRSYSRPPRAPPPGPAANRRRAPPAGAPSGAAAGTASTERRSLRTSVTVAPFARVAARLRLARLRLARSRLLRGSARSLLLRSLASPRGSASLGCASLEVASCAAPLAHFFLNGSLRSVFFSGAGGGRG